MGGSSDVESGEREMGGNERFKGGSCWADEEFCIVDGGIALSAGAGEEIESVGAGLSELYSWS